jgi:hypothetical protein
MGDGDRTKGDGLPQDPLPVLTTAVIPSTIRTENSSSNNSSRGGGLTSSAPVRTLPPFDDEGVAVVGGDKMVVVVGAKVNHPTNNLSSSSSTSTNHTTSKPSSTNSDTPQHSPHTTTTTITTTQNQQQQQATTAVNRGIDDLHLPTWLGFIAVSSVIRTTLQHPLNVALARKRIVQDGHVTLRDVFKDAFCTDKGKAGGGAGGGAGASKVLPNAGGAPQKLTVKGLVFGGVNGQCGRAGFRSLYRGYMTAVIGNAIGEMIYLSVIETVKGAAIRGVTNNNMDGSGGDDEDGGLGSAHTSPHGDSTASTDINISTATTSNAASSSSTPPDVARQATADAIAGVSGDMVAMSIAVPLSVALNRQMTAGYGLNSAGEYKSLRMTLKDLWREHQPHGSAAVSGVHQHHVLQRVQYGLRGLYTGFSVSLFALPATGIWWATYGLAKRSLYAAAGPTLERMERDNLLLQNANSATHASSSGGVNTMPHRKHSLSTNADATHAPTVGEAVQHSAAALVSHNWFLSPTDNPILNATAGVAATTITTILYNPVNVIRTRLQSLPAPPNGGVYTMGGSPSSTPHHQRRAPGGRVLGLCKDLLHKEGVRGFFKGTTLNLSVAVFDGVLFSTVYELGKLSSDKGLIGA